MSGQDKVAQWIRPQIRALSAYHVPEATGLIKLDAMENPYGWPQELVGQWLETLRTVALNRYPDPSAAELTAALRGAFDVPAGMEMVLGNGSDELIQMLALAVAEPGRTVLAPEPSFVMYRMIATFTGMEYVGVPLRGDDFALDMAAMRAAIATHRPALIFLAYPNNPTGNLFDEAQIREIIESAPGLVVVDEAYTAFAERSLMRALPDYDNLLVMRTVSKMGLAGLRLGLLTGAGEWLAEIDKVRLPYNINVLTQASAKFALQHKTLLDAQTASIRAERTRLLAALQQFDGVRAYPSAANFILFRTVPGQADGVFTALRKGGVLIKNLNPAGGALTDCLRVTVGRPEENDAFLQVLRSALAL